LTNFYTDVTTNFHNLFNKNKQLVEIDVSHFNTSNVTNMSYMFNELNEVTKIIGLENFDTSNVKNINYMFAECKKLENIDVSNFDTKILQI
jgi:surface protein